MLNSITIQGRFTRDPELRTTNSGLSVTSFSLACERDYADGAGKREADFIDVVAWRGTADFVARYFAKGQMAVVTGRLQIRDWEDNKGVKRKAAEIVADHVYFCGGKQDNARGGNAPPQFAPPPAADLFEGSDDDDELPF